MTHHDIAIRAAERFLGLPYLWGGDDPMSGFDCSGLMVEVLKSSGILPRHGDWTADSLMRFGWTERTPNERELEPGCLVFWGKTHPVQKATHVEMVYAVIGTDIITIGSSGGGSITNTAQDAVKQNAYVKLRPMRDNPIAARDPFAAVRER